MINMILKDISMAKLNEGSKKHELAFEAENHG